MKDVSSRYGCGNNIHIKCMKVWAQHRKSDGDNMIKCPLCRTDFGSYQVSLSSCCSHPYVIATMVFVLYQVKKLAIKKNHIGRGEFGTHVLSLQMLVSTCNLILSFCDYPVFPTLTNKKYLKVYQVMFLLLHAVFKTIEDNLQNFSVEEKLFDIYLLKKCGPLLLFWKLNCLFYRISFKNFTKCQISIDEKLKQMMYILVQHVITVKCLLFKENVSGLLASWYWWYLVRSRFYLSMWRSGD